MKNRKLCITNLPIEALHPHPQNPRKEMGDLTELADSIRELGIQQNLTVIPTRDEAGNEIEDSYTIIIGHRRLAAAKLAGLDEVPCHIRWDMTPAEQIALMLTENMQRNELTPQEEALAIKQLKLDFGWSVDKISECTGFSRTKVRSRLVIAGLDQKKVNAKMQEKQTCLNDFIELGKVKSVEKRNLLISYIGSPIFSSMCKAAIISEENEEFTEKLLALPFLKGAKTIEKYEADGYSDRYKLFKRLDIPEDRKLTPEFIDSLPPAPAGQKFHYIYVNTDKKEVGFYIKVKKLSPDSKDKQREEERKREIAKAWADLEEIWDLAYEARKKFVKNISYHTNEQKLLVLQGGLFARLGCNKYDSEMYNAIDEVLDIKYEKNRHVEENVRYKNIMDKMLNVDKKLMPEIIYSLFGDKNSCIEYGWTKRNWPVWRVRTELDSLYAWLRSLGYEISPDEQAIIDGSHKIFKRKNKFERWAKAQEKSDQQR